MQLRAYDAYSAAGTGSAGGSNPDEHEAAGHRRAKEDVRMNADALYTAFLIVMALASVFSAIVTLVLWIHGPDRR